MSVLEAMSVARPVIATGVGGVSEAVQDGETGILIPRDRPSELAAALIGLARDRLRAERLGRGGRARQQRLFSIDAMTRGYADLLARSRPCSRAVVPPQAVMERSSEGMKRPHIVIVNQNALLELDLRPRREAETLVAAGYLVTLVGGCRSPDTVREVTAADVRLELYAQPRAGIGVMGQIREQSQAMARAMMAVRRASTARAGGGGARREPSRQLLSRPARPAATAGIHAPVCVRSARCGAGTADREILRSVAREAAGRHGPRDRAAELRHCRVGRVRQRQVPCSGGARGVAARGLGGCVERMVVAGCATGSALAQRRRPSPGVRRDDQRAGQRRPPCRCARGPADSPPAQDGRRGLWLRLRRSQAARARAWSRRIIRMARTREGTCPDRRARSVQRMFAWRPKSTPSSTGSPRSSRSSSTCRRARQ